MEATATTSKLLLETGQYLASLHQHLRSNLDFQELARQLGWDISTLPAPLTNLLPQLAQLEAAVQAVLNEANLSNLAALNTSVTTVYAAIKNLANETYALPPPLDANTFKAEFPEQLLNVLLVEYLQTYQSQIYGLLYGVSIITKEYIPASVGRVAYVRVGLNLHLLADLLRNPVTFWRTVYGWGGTFAYDRLVMAVGELLDRLGVPTGYLAADYALLTTINPGPIPGSLPVINALQVSLLHTITRLGELYMGVQLLPVLSPTGTPQGVALAAQALGALNETIDLGNNFSLTLVGEAGLAAGIGLALQPTQPLQVKSLASAGAAMSGKFEAAIRRLPTGVADTPHLLLRTPGNTELTYETITWKMGALAGTTAATDLYTEFKITALRFASGEADSDSFLNEVLKNFHFKTDLSVGISKAKGFYFDVAGGLNSKQTKNISLGPVQLTNVSFAVETVNGFTYLTIGSDVHAKLGPVQVNISEVGLRAGLKYSASGGTIGPFSADIAFKPPTALGISIKTDAITGGGFLYFDSVNQKYAGVASVLVKDKLNLNAIGLLQTRLPSGRRGYSFLLLITAEFTPIQLGMGFTLNGIGGLIGINRTSNIPYLRSQVQAGNLSNLLFPANVVNNATEVLATADTAFPVAEGRYVFGILARVGWGSPTTLLTLDLALIIELPAPVRLILLGVLKATLPDERNAILVLRANFLGTVDFGAKRISFDASLVGSRILQFTLTGDAAFRLYQGANPIFLLTSGGFHPAFRPPANADLPTLRRLTLALAQGGDFSLTLSTYLAVTSNTVQFGSRLDLYVRLPASFSLVGFLSFDALFQFNPFRIQVQVAAGVAIKKGNSTKLTLNLNLALSGPAPWHANGEGSFKILFIKIKFRVERTFGGGAAPQPLPDTNVRPLLQQALEDRANWEVEQPVNRTSNSVVLRVQEVTDQLLVDPSGALVVRQKVAPLAYPMERFGDARPVNGNRFDITRVIIGVTGADPIDLSGSGLQEVKDYFSPGQFRRMSNAEKLSAPSFQQMRNGVRLAGLAGYAGGPASAKAVAYEQIILRDLTGTTGSTPLPPLPSTPVVVPAQQYQQLIKNSAVGRSARSFERRRPSRKAPDQIFWDEDDYLIVSTRDLSPLEGTASFPNEAQATAHFNQLLQSDPSRAGELQVVPGYQLNVPAI